MRTHAYPQSCAFSCFAVGNPALSVRGRGLSERGAYSDASKVGVVRVRAATTTSRMHTRMEDILWPMQGRENAVSYPMLCDTMDKTILTDHLMDQGLSSQSDRSGLFSGGAIRWN